MTMERNSLDPDPEAKPKPSRLASVLSIVGFIVGFIAVRLLPMELTIRFVAGALVGCLLGLIPYFSFRGGDEVFAKRSVGYCALGGLLGGVLLGIPTVIVVWIIGRRRARRIETSQFSERGLEGNAKLVEHPPILP